jgi:hypothetical protein
LENVTKISVNKVDIILEPESQGISISAAHNMLKKPNARKFVGGILLQMSF